MIKVVNFHQLMSHLWNIVTSDDLDGFSEDIILPITQSTNENNIFKSESSQLQNPLHMIKVGSCHRLMHRPW